MTPHRLAALLAAATLPVAGHAAPVTLDFEGATSLQSIATFYAGGSDGAGATGANRNVSFTSPALALSNDALGSYFSNAPTPGTVMFAPDADALMNVPGGFSGSLQFFYSSASAGNGLVKLFSGLDGSGSLLGSANLLANATNGCSDTAFCHFDAVSVTFSGIARSVSFGSNAGNVAYDNVTLAAVPEPQSLALAVVALAAVGLARRQRRA